MAKKQESSAIPLIAGAVGFGIVAALLAMFYLNTKEAELKKQYEQDQSRTSRVVVANQDLRKGQEITREVVQARQIPNDFVHDDAIFPGDFDRYVGRSLVANVGRGKTLLKSFMDEDFPRDFSDVIPAGKRAMTITVDDINSIGGFLRPGNRIDIFVNIPFGASGFSPEVFEAAKEAGLLALLPTEILTSIPGELLDAASGVANPTELLGMLAPDDVVIPVLQNITVLAAGKDPYRETLDALRQPQRRTESTFSHITLEVDPQQAALMTLAIDKGDIVALLRNRDDQSASDFTTVGSPDLFTNATRMAQAEKERASRAATASGVDQNGNLVDADGNKLMSAKELAAAGLTVNENGQIVDKDGNVVNPEDIVIGPDGTVMTKQQLAAAGLSVNASGQIVDKDGNIVDINDVVIGPDGAIVTKQQLAASGLSVNANGEIVDAQGRVVSADDMVTLADGSVMTKEQLAAAGYTVNENGDIVDKDGNVIDPDSIVVMADGSFMTKQQLADAGLSVDENGNIVDKNGNIVDPNDLIVGPGGEVLSKKALAAKGLSVNENGEIVDENGVVLSNAEIAAVAESMTILGGSKGGRFKLIIGGSSEDGVAKSLDVSIEPVVVPSAP